MATDTYLENSTRRSPLRARRTTTIRPVAWLRSFPGATTMPSQQAVDAISNSPEFPRH